MKQADKTRVKSLLEERLKRTAKSNEVINAETDIGILVPLLLEKVDALEVRVKKLEDAKLI